MVGWHDTLAVWPALLTVGGTFATVQFLWSNYVGFELVDLMSAVTSLLAGMIVLRVWKPKNEWRFPLERESAAPVAAEDGTEHPLTPGRVAVAWMPFGLLTLTVLIWGMPPIESLGTPAVKTWMDSHTSRKVKIDRLHKKIAKGVSVTGHEVPDSEKDFETAEVDLVPISSTGTAVFVAALLSGALLRVNPRNMARLFLGTVRRMIPAMAAIFCMLALGFVTKYSGMDAVLGLAFTRTGPLLYPLFGTMLGWLGVALTGSDTSSNVLFGNLQKITAQKLGLSPILMASANTTGGVMGKMIDAQSIVVAAAATGEGGREGELLRKVLWHSIVLALVVGLIVSIYARFPAIIVEPPAR
jgi:lactate permease